MAETYNQELFDAIVRHQIGLLRFSAGVRNKVWRLLDATEKDLRAQIQALAGAAGFDTPARLRRFEKLIGLLRETRVGAWKKVRAEWFAEMRALATAEPDFVDRIVRGIVPVELSTVIPDAQHLRNLALATPFEGKVLQEWFADTRRADLSRIEAAVKIGLVQGETPPQIARRLVGTVALAGRNGVTQITRREAALAIRTVVSGIASQSRDLYMRANADIMPRKIFIATLDSKTTPICRSLDGEVYDVDDDSAPVLPLHRGERSGYGPSLDGEAIGERPARNFTERSLLREFAAREGLDKVPRTRKDLPRGTKGAFDAFARVRMRELTGAVASSTTYQQFLARQTAAVQDDILGPTRGKLFRQGGLTLKKFVDVDGSTLTLEELADRYASAFKAAGLDPSAY